MKLRITLSVILFLSNLSLAANAAMMYEIEITNGLNMPISGGVLYSQMGGASASEIGTEPTPGFIGLCQTGNSMGRSKELRENSRRSFSVVDVPGPTLPSQKIVQVVKINYPKTQSIHFEAMYGMTKDVCGVFSINSHTLVALAQRATKEVVLGDHAVLTGAFLEPVVPEGMSYLDPEFCEGVPTALDCLRQNSELNDGNKFIHSFAGYFPSFISGLEMKYGSSAIRPLIFPNSNGLKIKIRLKD